MSNAFFEQPILNSPYAYPERHWELDEETGQPTQRIIPSRRKADFVTPIPKPRQHAEARKQAQLGLDDDAGLLTDDQRYARPPSSGRCASKWIVGASCYDALMRVRVSNDLVHWIRFFLNGVAETASKGRDVFRSILDIQRDADERVAALGRRAPNARKALQARYRRPVMAAADLENAIQVSRPTAHALVKELERLGLIKEVTGQMRDRLYVFETYLSLFLC